MWGVRFFCYLCGDYNKYCVSMRYIRICLMAVMAVMLFSAFTMKGKEKPVYMF